ncbi:serine/threonine-protein kinase [Nocardia sp. NPDC005366]|uniref:serine/threonine-protein kinase n=1 Tax=Nocardia sp. NPDC005366 TaxID=3156878 RepID=UPI0033B44EC6
MKPLGRNDPQTVGRHRLVAVIGQGAMGRVLLGRAPDGRSVAVKMIHRHLASSPEFRARFRREVEASRRVTGAYTAAVMDADPDAPEPWLASVFVPGPSLRDAIDRFGPMAPGGLRLLTAGLASALIEIHRAGIVHRDLKPGNVLLADGGPRVIDFGIARALTADLQLTSTGSVVGSPAFMSPEQAQGRTLSAASDVFSVGAMLVLAATGESPFHGASTPQTLYNVVHNRADTAGLPPMLRSVVEACLDKNPAHRPTPNQLLESVDATTAGAGWPAGLRREIARQRVAAETWIASDGQPSTEPGPRRTVRWFAAASILTLLAVGIAAAVLLGKGSEVTDPIGNRTLDLSDDQLRLMNTCALLGDDVVGALGQPGTAELSNSAECAVDLTTSEGRRMRASVGVGTAVAPSDPEVGAVVAGRQIVGHSEAGFCGRAAIIREQPKLGVGVTIAAESDACALATEALEAVVTRLITDPPLSNPPRQSVLRVDPCAAVDRGVLDAVVGTGAQPAPVDGHTCRWEGAPFTVTVRPIEQRRVDADPAYARLAVDGGKLGFLDISRQAAADGTCSTYHLLRSTVADRGELIVVSARPTSPEAEQNACTATESLVISIVARIRSS